MHSGRWENPSRMGEGWPGLLVGTPAPARWFEGAWHPWPASMASCCASRWCWACGPRGERWAARDMGWWPTRGGKVLDGTGYEPSEDRMRWLAGTTCCAGSRSPWTCQRGSGTARRCRRSQADIRAWAYGPAHPWRRACPCSPRSR